MSTPSLFLTRPSILATAGALLLTRELVFYAAFAVLATSIQWPASLGLPAAEALPLIRQHERAGFIGYYLYLLSSVMFLPIAFALRASLSPIPSSTPSPARPFLQLLLDTAVGFTILSVVMRCLGILRWLFAMPALAAAYTDPAASPSARETATFQFDLLNNYAGQAGEHLGVHLSAALFMACFAAALFLRRDIPKTFAVWAALSAALFIPLPDLLGFDGGPILFINGFTYSFWAIGFGIYLLRRAHLSRKTTRLAPTP